MTWREVGLRAHFSDSKNEFLNTRWCCMIGSSIFFHSTVCGCELCDACPGQLVGELRAGWTSYRLALWYHAWSIQVGIFIWQLPRGEVFSPLLCKVETIKEYLYISYRLALWYHGLFRLAFLAASVPDCREQHLHMEKKNSWPRLHAGTEVFSPLHSVETIKEDRCVARIKSYN